MGILVLIGALGVAAMFLIRKPSNNRSWNVDQKILPKAEIHGNLVTVRNVRNFTYQSTIEYTPGYYDATYDVDNLKRIYYVVEPFGSIKGAHTFLSFEFEGNQFVSVSIEIRKREGESFKEWKAVLPYYELMYVVADEKDVIKLRSNFRKDIVFLYPVKATPEARKAIFLDYMARVNKLYDKPEFYNLFTNTCTTNILDTINRATEKKINWSYEVMFPSLSDEYAMKLGLLDTNLSLEEARNMYNINEKAEAAANDPDFSLKIREGALWP